MFCEGVKVPVGGESQIRIVVVWFTSRGKSVVCESEIALGRTFKGFVLLATPSRGEDGVIIFLSAVDISVRIKHLFTIL